MAAHPTAKKGIWKLINLVAVCLLIYYSQYIEMWWVDVRTMIDNDIVRLEEQDLRIGMRAELLWFLDHILGFLIFALWRWLVLTRKILNRAGY